MMMLSRREFLRRSALAVVAVGAGPTIPPLPIAGKGRPKNILIIGAGLAGLSAAYELTKGGHTVTLLEARSRPGGRVYTLRDPFDDGLYAEAGATRIPDNHTATLRYIKVFDLPLTPFRPGGLSTMYYIHGQRIIYKRGAKIAWPLNLSTEERDLGLQGMRDKYITSALKELGENLDLNLHSPLLTTWDHLTWPQFLKQRGASDDAISLLTYGHNAGVLGSVSALLWLRYSAFRRKRSQLFKIEGGNDLLPQAFAKTLDRKIRYNSPVIGIRQTAEQVHVDFLNNGTRESMVGEYLICTLPFSVLKKIEVSPSFSREKRDAIEQLEYVSCSRVYLQMKKRFWTDLGADGFAVTDLPISEVWDASYGERKQRGILLSYMTGDYSHQLCSLMEHERIRTVAAQLEKIYPQSSEHFEKGISFCWDEDPWARGAWALLKPGQIGSLLSHISAPEGRVHFAGDHASDWPGWMQGALESGIRASREVDEAQ